MNQFDLHVDPLNPFFKVSDGIVWRQAAKRGTRAGADTIDDTRECFVADIPIPYTVVG